MSIVILIGLIVIAAQAFSRLQPEKFLADHRLEITTQACQYARRYLERDRWYRTLGAWVGLCVAVASSTVLNLPSGFGTLHIAAIVAGSSVGVIWAARAPRYERPAQRGASLQPRYLDDYTTARMRRWEVAADMICCGSLLALTAAMTQASERVGSRWALAGTAVAALCLPAISRAQRTIVAAPRPLADPHLIAVDDARRASVVQSLHHCALALAACGLTVACSGFFVLSSRWEVRDHEVPIYRSNIAQSASFSSGELAANGDFVVYTGAAGSSGFTDAVVVRSPTGQPNEGSVQWSVSARPNQSILIATWALAILSLVQWRRIRRAPFTPIAPTVGAARHAAHSPTASR